MPRRIAVSQHKQLASRHRAVSRAEIDVVLSRRAQRRIAWRTSGRQWRRRVVILNFGKA